MLLNLVEKHKKTILFKYTLMNLKLWKCKKKLLSFF